jgi:hypothetical protein
MTSLLALGLVAGGPVATASSPPPQESAVQPASRAGGAVTLGEVQGGVDNCFFGSAAFGVTSALEDPARPSYVAPFSGVLTSYSYFAGTNGGSVQVLVLKAGADAAHKVVAAKSIKQAVVPSTLTTFATRLPMKAGERIGIGFGQNGMSCLITASAADSTFVAYPFDADTTSDMAAPGSDFGEGRPNVSAVLEPDADGDGYGDVSQDRCPQSATTLVACPAPDTTVTKAPKKSTRHRAKITFGSTITASTFTCMVDGKAPVPCTSPFKKNYGYGRHLVLITAFSPVGIADLTPAAVMVRIKRPKR